MTSIAVIFILLFLLFLRNEQVESAGRKEQTKSNVDYLLQRLKEEFSKDVGIKIEKDKHDPLTFRIVLIENKERLGFEHNKHRVQQKGKEFLRGFIPRLSKILCSHEVEDKLDSLIIEGHTDSTGDDDRNTELSASRATAVLIESRKILAKPSFEEDAQLELLERCFLHISQATGRGEQELVQNAGVEDRKASRRVVLKVRVKSMEQRDTLREDIQEAAIDG